MSSLAALQSRFEDSLSELMTRYGFAVASSDDSRFTLASASSRIVFLFGRNPEEIVLVSIFAGETGPFDLLYVMLLRNNYTIVPYKRNPSLSIEDAFSDRLRWVQREMIACCDDLLRGDSTLLIGRDHYYEFERFMKRAFDHVYSAPDDPVSKKYRSGDWSWVRDLWFRERR